MKRNWQKNVLLGVSVFVVFLMYRFVEKSTLIVFIKSVLPGDMSGLVSGIVFGEKGLISKYWYEIFIGVGVIHVVVASGSNLAIISSILIDRVAWILGRKRAIILGLLMVCFYINLIGFEAPVARAAIILFIYYWAQFLGRKFNMMSALTLMLFVMVLVDLDMVLSVSFWMSLVAFVAVVSWEEIGEILVKKKRQDNVLFVLIRRAGWLFGLNIWISLWMWPITSMVFGQLNLLSILVNVLVLFGVEFVFVLTLVSMVLLLASRFLASSALMLTLPFLKYFLELCRWTAGLGFGVWEFRFNWFMVIGWYLVLSSLLLRRNTRS